jgi:hypothetical protein
MYVPYNSSHCSDIILPRNGPTISAYVLSMDVLMLMLLTKSDTQRFGTYIIGCSLYPHPCDDSQRGGSDIRVICKLTA